MDSALWLQAQRDYFIALRGAIKAWDDCDVPARPMPSSEAIQAAAATIMLHHKYLAEQERLHVKVPSPAAPVAATGRVPSTASTGTVPTCKECGGAMLDQRTTKKTPKSPDFVCLQENGKCGKPSKDGKFFNATAQWVEKPNPKGAQGMATVAASAPDYKDYPKALDEGGDDLPF